MIISLPLTTNLSTQYSEILAKWKFERDLAKEKVKQNIILGRQFSWWEKLVGSKKTQEEYFKENTRHWSQQGYWEYEEAKWTRMSEINMLTSLLAADKLTLLTKTTSTYELEKELVAALNKEIHNV